MTIGNFSRITLGTGLTGTDLGGGEIEIASSGSGIPASIVDAKGDLIVASAADTVARLPVGADDDVLVAASGETLGVKWSPASGGVTQLAYQEKTSVTIITATTEAGATTIATAASITADGSTRICVEVFAYSADTGGANQLDLPLFDSFNGGAAASLGTMASHYNSNATSVFARRFLTPAAGTHVYSWRGYKSGGTVSVYAGAGGAGLPMPAYIRVTSGA